MRKLLSGVLLSATVLMGASPFVSAAHADTSSTDPVLCFVAAQSIITEALNGFHAGGLTIGDLRSVLVGTASFLGDCLTPTEAPVTLPPITSPPVILPPIMLPTTLPGFPNITLPSIPTIPIVNTPTS